MGYYYENGVVVRQNIAIAAQCYEDAARKGNIDAMYKLGLYYENGEGVSQIYEEAAKWYKKAAEMGNVNAMDKLGLCYANGVGVPQDCESAARWRDAAFKGGFKDTNIDLETYSRVIDDIFNLMKNPSDKSIMDKVKSYCEKVDLSLKLFVVKHLIFLKSMGNQEAIKALNEIRPDIKRECYPSECIAEGELSPEKKEKLFAEKKALDLEYARYIDGFGFLKQDVESEETKVCGQRTGDHLTNSSSLIKNKDLLFSPKLSAEQIWCYWKSFDVVSEGWKIHISAQPSSALKIAQIAIPILQKHDIPFKICESLDALRVLNLLPINLNSLETQAGKFITIYPKTADESARLVKELDEAFVKAIDEEELHSYDFCELIGDAMIGESGAVYSRYGKYRPCSDIVEEKRLPVNFREKEPKMPKGSPFEGLKIRFLGKDLPADDCSCWTEDTSLLSNCLVLNERYKMLTKQSSLSDSVSSFK